MSKIGSTIVMILTIISLSIAIVVGAFTVCFMIKDAKKPLVADVECVQWEAPKTVVTDLLVMDRKRTDPNRMTADRANNSRSLYIITLNNKDKDCSKNTRMSVPSSLYWEVTEPGRKTKSLLETGLVTLHNIDSGRPVEVKVWASCEPGRSDAGEVLVTQNSNYPARVNIIKPVRASFQCLDQLLPTNRRCFILVSIMLISICCILIIKKKFFS